MPMQRGFTLIEMIVVLVIASLALMLGFQSLSQWQRAQEALTRITASTRSTGLVEAWWRESVTGSTAVLDSPFKGTPDGFEGYTLTPVFGTQGSTTTVAWKVLGGQGESLKLQLTEDENTRQFELPDMHAARFSYVSRDGKVSDRWPMTLGKPEEDTNLPSLIRLTFEDAEGEESAIWVAAVTGPLDPVYKPAQIEED